MGLVLGDLAAVIRTDDRPLEEGLNDARTKLQRFGDKAQQILSVAGAAAGAALAAGVVGALSIDAGNDRLAAQLGLAAEESGRIGKIAGDLYADNFGESMADVDDAVGAVISSIDGMRTASSDVLQDISSDAITLADLFEVDVARAAQVAGQAVKSGLAVDAKQAFDLLSISMQKLPANVREDLLDAVDEYGPFLANIGIKGEEAFSLLVASAKKGAFGLDKTGDALKEFTIRATDMSTASKAGYDALGLSQEKFSRALLKGGTEGAAAFDQIVSGLLKIKDPVAQSQAALALFGTPLEDLSVSEIPAFLTSLQGVEGGLGDVEGAANRMSDAVGDNATSKLEGFKRKAQQAFMETLAKAIPTIEKVVDFLGRHEKIVAPLVVGLTALAVVIGVMSVAMKAYTVVQTFANLALWAFPATWIVLAIIALVAIIVIIATKTTWFQTLWKTVWGGIKDAAAAVGRWFMDVLWGAYIKPTFDGIAAAAMWLWHNAIEPAWNGIQSAIAFVVNIIVSLANLSSFLFRETIGAAALWLWREAIEPAFNGIAAVAVWLWDNVLKPTWDAIVVGVRMVGDAATWLWREAIEPAFNGVAVVAKWLWDKVISPTFDAISGAVNTVGDTIRDVFAKVGGWISAAFGAASGIVKGAMNGVIGVINSALGGINSVIRKANEIPGVNFPTINTIPKLARGGYIPATPGGRIVTVGEGGKGEIVEPEDKMAALLRDAVAAGRGDGHAEQPIQFTANLVVDNEVIDSRTLQVMRDHPDEVALAVRAGGKSLHFGD